MLRLSMAVQPLADPRLFDWAEQGNLARQSLEPLVRFGPDYVFHPWLLESWEASPDVRAYLLRLRRGVTWSNGDPFDVRDVAANLMRWCDRTVAGNSMAARVAALIDPDTGRARAGAVEPLDAHTLRLNLAFPDATLVAGFADYPALIVHRDFDAQGADWSARPIGTGPFELQGLEPGVSASVRRRADGRWWGGAALLDGVDFLDPGPDPAAEIAAFGEGRIDANYWSVGATVERLDALGLRRSRAATTATVVARMNTRVPPYDDVRVRRAVQLSVDPETVLQIGFGGAGRPAENHHVGPLHPDYARLDPFRRDPAESRRLAAEAGAAGFEHELVSVDDDFRRDTADAVAAQMLDTGLRVRRTLAPAAEFRERWKDYAFSVTNWNMRPLGVQTLALAYRSGEAWNETGFADPVFDAGLDRALGLVDAVARREVMADLQRRLQSSGVIVQPYWQDLFCHARPEVAGYGKHPTHELHLEAVWLAAP